ncbi:MAG: AAA family ATPase [Ktedonobacteraceae bacterium]|nr:AAA family ATPase [Ktedonobacteraceae bacterium]
MSKCYLLFIQPDLVQRTLSSAPSRFTLHHDAHSLQEDDTILPVRIGKNNTILPFVYRIVSLNRSTGTLTLQLEAIQMHSLDLKDLTELNTSGQPYTQYDSITLTQSQFERISARMGGRRMAERDLLENVNKYITARGYYFDTETLYNYHICLKTRPFVILAGLSGTGKSKLSQLYAEALGHREHYRRLPVRPNWNDDRYLLGYFNTITGRYVTEPAVEFLQDANADEDNLYFFCLDEMNLAHVEYYFSQFLSAMEEERPEDRQITLLSRSAQQEMLAQPGQAELVTSLAQVLIPTNLFFTGTINVDETTQPISDKVMDRANTLEFFKVDLEQIPQPTEPPPPTLISAYTWRSYLAHTPDASFRPQIIALSKLLNKADLGLGYRVLHEIELYLANSAGLLDPLVAFDLQVKQRILPRVRGSLAIADTIDELLAYLKAQRLTRSEERLQEMKNRLKRDGYTNFWR